MTTPIAGYTWLTLTADADTPAEALPYAGRLIGLTPADVALLGSGPGNPGVLAGIRGYVVQGTASFLMTSPIDAASVAFIRAIPGPGGWNSGPARAVYRNTATHLVVNLGVPVIEARDALKRLYDAAVANYTAPPP